MTHALPRRAGATLGLIGALAAASFIVAPGAQAVGGLVDNGNGTMTATNVSSFGPNGLWICTTLTPAAACDGTTFTYGTYSSGVYQVGTTVFNQSAYVGLPAGVYNVQLIDAPGSPIGLTNVRIGAAPAPAPANTSNTPAPIMQAFPAPSFGTCDEVAHSSLNWGGASSGGWSRSWHQWVNDSAGGPVCQRTLRYSATTGSWVVA